MKNKTEKYYIVIAKCGHVGRRKYVPVNFAIKAESGKEAARLARQIPRVKHDHKDAILSVRDVDVEEYIEMLDMNNNDPYLQCRSRHEQNLIPNLNERIVTDKHSVQKKWDKKSRRARVEYKLRKYRAIEKLSLLEVYGYED